MTTSPISVTLPVGQAIERTKWLLFRPFEPAKWFVIGFCAWLAYFGRSGGFGFHVPGGGQGGDGNLRDAIESARNYVAGNLYWIVPLSIVAMTFILILGVAVLWLRCRGEFMFLHCVARNRAEVAGPWTAFSREGNSLFLFRLVLGAVEIFATWPLLILCGIRFYRMWVNGDWNAGGILGCLGLGLVFVGAVIVFAIVEKLASDFVVPIMFLGRKRCMEGWRELGRLLAAQPGQFILYFLFQIVLAIAIGTLVAVVVVVTCCIAGCLLILPYLGTVLLLPVLVFKRSYSVFYLAQYGPGYDAFAPPPTPPSPALEPPPTAA